MASVAYLSWARLQVPVWALTGSASASAQGSLASSVSVTLTGVSLPASAGLTGPGQVLSGTGLTVSRGTFLGGSQRAYLTWAEFQIPSFTGTNQALAGVSATVSRGSVALQATRAYWSWAKLTLPLSSAVSVALTGVAATSARGTTSPAQGTVQALTGQAGTSSGGTLVNGSFGSLTSAAMTAGQGVVGPADETFAFAGFALPTVTVTLAQTGLQAAYGPIALVVNGALVQTLAGLPFTAAQGASAPAITVALAGFGTVAGVGSFEKSTLLVGAEATAQSGALANGIPLAVDPLTAAAGMFGCDQSVTLTGLEMAADEGGLSFVAWLPVASAGGIWTSVGNGVTVWVPE